MYMVQLPWRPTVISSPSSTYASVELLKRVLDRDALRCPRCHQRMVPVQTVKDPLVIRKILSHLGLPSELPTPTAARAPPQQAFDFDSADDNDLFEVPFHV